MLATLQTGTRQRESRTKILVPCRMKRGTQWVDACIHNFSSRGVLVGIKDSPPPGSYIEIRQGSLVIVGRVVWQREGFVGIRTQDIISLTTLINKTREAAPNKAGQRGSATSAEDRPSNARLEAEGQIGRRVERNRHVSMTLQFGALLCVGVAAAVFAASSVQQVLDRPAVIISAAIQGRPK